MKNITLDFLTGRSSHLNLVCGILILLTLVLGCSDSGDSGSSNETVKKTVPPAYVGVWTGQDGSTVAIRNDGSGDYKSGGKSVEGAAVEIDEAAKEIRFSFLGFDSGKYKIEQPPKGNKMKLDGMEYRRTGGFSTDEPESKSNAKTESGAVPSEDELRPLVTETIKNLDEAIQQGDFTEFRETVSEMMRNQKTVADFNEAFADTILRKEKYKLKADAPLTFTTKPVLKENDSFEIDGTYLATNGRTVRFSARYVKEYDEWKSLGVFLNP